MLITPTNLKTLFIGFKTNFQSGLNTAQSLYQQLATVVPSSTGTEEYGWLGQMPGMREWIGERVVHGMESHGYSIKNKKFELTVSVPKEAIEDDTHGTYTPMMAELGRASGAHPDELTFGLLKEGASVKCYDGKPFFAANHPVKNALGKLESVSNADLAGNGPLWFVLDTSRVIKPVIFQDRKKPNFVSMTAETDPNVYSKSQFEYGVDSRCNVGFGFWQMAHACNQELTPDNLWKAIKAIETRKGDFGRPLAMRASVLVVPPSMQDVANKLLTADLLASGGVTETNTLKSRLKSLVVPWL